jgi:hypothetical protein
VKFKDLAIGDTFRFMSEFTMPHSGMKTGLCQKIGRRKYIYTEDGNKPEYEVGTVTVEVVSKPDQD